MLSDTRAWLCIPLGDFITLQLLSLLSYLGLFTKTHKIRSTLTKEVTEMAE
jgi:hypothetical protein